MLRNNAHIPIAYIMGNKFKFQCLPATSHSMLNVIINDLSNKCIIINCIVLYDKSSQCNVLVEILINLFDWSYAWFPYKLNQKCALYHLLYGSTRYIYIYMLVAWIVDLRINDIMWVKEEKSLNGKLKQYVSYECWDQSKLNWCVTWNIWRSCNI